MARCHPFPHGPARCGWLLTDARLTGHGLIAARRLPPGSVIVVRSDALGRVARCLLIRRLRRVAHARRCTVLIAAVTPNQALRMGADGVHLRCRDARRAAIARRLGLTTSAPVHDRREAAAVRRAGIGHAVISPLHATRSHPDAATLSVRAWLRLARDSAAVPVALGGMTAARQRELWRRCAGTAVSPQWAAIDAWEMAASAAGKARARQKRNCVPT